MGGHLPGRLMRSAGVAEGLEPGQLGSDSPMPGSPAQDWRNSQRPAAQAGGLDSAVDLHRPDDERHLADRVVEESRGAFGKASSGAYGFELLDAEAGVDGDARVIDPDHLAGISCADAATQAPDLRRYLAFAHP